MYSIDRRRRGHGVVTREGYEEVTRNERSVRVEH